MYPERRWENEKEDAYRFGFISHYPALLLKTTSIPQVQSVLLMTIIPEQYLCPCLEPQGLYSYFALPFKAASQG